MLDTFLLLAQADAPQQAQQAQQFSLDMPARLLNFVYWVYVIGDPSVTLKGIVGSLLTWLKIVGLFSLVEAAGNRLTLREG